MFSIYRVVGKVPTSIKTDREAPHNPAGAGLILAHFGHFSSLMLTVYPCTPLWGETKAGSSGPGFYFTATTFTGTAVIKASPVIGSYR